MINQSFSLIFKPSCIFLVLFLFGLGTPQCFAQNDGNMQDVVYLTNGSIIRGTATYINDSTSIRITTVGENVFVYDLTSVEKVTREPIPGSSQKFVPRKNGITGSWDIGILPNASEAGHLNVAAGILIALGTQIRPNLSLMIGSGVENFDDEPFLPVFSDFRYFLNSHKAFQPMFVLKSGYSWPVSGLVGGNNNFSRTIGGILIAPGAGFRTYLNKTTMLIFSLGYRHQNSTYIYTWGRDDFEERRKFQFRRFEGRLGFMF